MLFGLKNGKCLRQGDLQTRRGEIICKPKVSIWMPETLDDKVMANT